MRVPAFGFALTALVAGAATGEDSPWNHLETVWEAKAELQFTLAPLLDQGLMPVLNHVPDPAHPGPGTPQLSLLDLEAGTAKWTIPTGSDVECMVSAGDLIVLATSGTGAAEPAMVAACRVADGEVVWRLPLEARLDCGADQDPASRQRNGYEDWARTPGIGGGLVAEGDRVFLKEGQRVFCLARESGNVLWGTDVGFSLSAPLTPCGKLLLAANTGQGLHALDQQTGGILWTAPIDNTMRIYSLGDPIYIETHDYWFGRLDPATGAPMWQINVGSPGLMSADPVADKLILRSLDSVWILDAATGAEELKAPTSAGYASAFSDDTLYYCLPTAAGAHPTELVAVGIADHRERWRVPLDAAPDSLHHIAGNLLVSWTSFDIGALRPADGSVFWEWHGQIAGGCIDDRSLTGEGNRIYFHTTDRVIGFDSETGKRFLDAPGAFYQRTTTGAFGPRPMPWMRLRGDSLCMRDLTDNEECLMSVRLTRVEGEPAGN